MEETKYEHSRANRPSQQKKKVDIDLLRNVVWVMFLEKVKADEEPCFTMTEVIKMINLAKQVEDEDNNRRS